MADAIDALEQRLGQLEDERAIHALLYAYGLALDYGDREQFLLCFTDDADYTVTMRVDAGNGFAFHGRDELTGYFDGHTHAPAAWHKHITTNPSVDVGGGQAEAVSYFLRVDAGSTAGPGTVLASGRYLDALVKGDDGRWRIRSRTCEVENM